MLLDESLKLINTYQGENIQVSYVKNVNGKWPLTQIVGELILCELDSEDNQYFPYISIRNNGSSTRIPLSHVSYIKANNDKTLFENVFAQNQFLTDSEKLIQLFNEDKDFCEKVYYASKKSTPPASTSNDNNVVNEEKLEKIQDTNTNNNTNTNTNIITTNIEDYNITSEPDFGEKQEESLNELNLYNVTISPITNAQVELNGTTFPTIKAQQIINHDNY